MKKTQVLICDDHAIVRKGLRSLLDNEDWIEIIAEADTGRDALEKAQELMPTVILMDISMPDMNGLEATIQIKQKLPETKILILTMHDDEEYVFEILRAGASGYVLKQSATSELILAIEAISDGKAFLSPSISGSVIEGYLQQAKSIPQGDSFHLLTKREREVLQLIAEGHSTRGIAEKLTVSIKTIETHRANIMKKLDRKSIAELVKYAVRKGLVAE